MNYKNTPPPPCFVSCIFFQYSYICIVSNFLLKNPSTNQNKVIKSHFPYCMPLQLWWYAPTQNHNWSGDMHWHKITTDVVICTDTKSQLMWWYAPTQNHNWSGDTHWHKGRSKSKSLRITVRKVLRKKRMISMSKIGMFDLIRFYLYILFFFKGFDKTNVVVKTICIMYITEQI